jgi:hypothetical protein
LRKALRHSFAEVLTSYNQVCTVVNGFAEQTDLEKYYDIYDITDFDMSDARRGLSDEDMEDPESLRTLKILAARFSTIRKLFLCALLALDANSDANDLLRWTTAVESLLSLNNSTQAAHSRLQSILSEEDSEYLAFQLDNQPLTNVTRFPISSDTDECSYTRTGTLASPTSEARLSFYRNQRLASQATIAPRGIRQESERLKRHFGAWPESHGAI